MLCILRNEALTIFIHHNVFSVIDVIADKNGVTKIMNDSTGLQRIELNGFAKRHLEIWLLPLFIWLVFRPVLRPKLVPVVWGINTLLDGDTANFWEEI